MPSPSKRKAANLRSWRVIIIRSKGEYLGSVEAPDRERAEAAIKQFDLDNYQRPRLLIHSRAAIAPPTGWQNSSKLPYAEMTGSGVISSRVARGSTLTKDSLRSAFRWVHHSVQGCRPAQVQTPLRDVAPGLNGRASLAGARPCLTGGASFTAARVLGRGLRRA
jgi:hypothetical protein